jgi:hypothetical protein
VAIIKPADDWFQAMPLKRHREEEPEDILKRKMGYGKFHEA